MLAELYVEALLFDEELADQASEPWSAGEITDELAVWAWWLMTHGCDFRPRRPNMG